MDYPKFIDSNQKEEFIRIQRVKKHFWNNVNLNINGDDNTKAQRSRYSNLFLNAYINHHAHTEYLKMIEVYSPCSIWHVFLYSINTNIYHLRSTKYLQYA